MRIEEALGQCGVIGWNALLIGEPAERNSMTESGHYAQVATMHSSHKQVVASPGAARHSAVSIGVELDIVSAAECSGGLTSGDRDGKHSIISNQPRRPARQRAARTARRCDQAVHDKRRFRVPDSLKELCSANIRSGHLGRQRIFVMQAAQYRFDAQHKAPADLMPGKLSRRSHGRRW